MSYRAVLAFCYMAGGGGGELQIKPPEFLVSASSLLFQLPEFFSIFMLQTKKANSYIYTLHSPNIIQKNTFFSVATY